MSSSGDGSSVRGRGEYLLLYRDYAARFKSSERTVKRWVKIGRENGSHCPLDSPQEMVGWWEKNMTQRVPAEIWEAAGPDAAMEIPPVVVKKPDPPAAPSMPVDIPVTGDLGLEAELGALEILARTLRANAHEAGKQKGYLDTVARLGTLSAKLREEAERMKKLLPRDAVEAAIHEFHGPIEREVRLLYRTMCDVLGLPPSPEREEAWNRELDRLFVRLGEEILAAA